VNFAKLNHILIPATKEGRDRVRGTLVGRVFDALYGVYLSLSRRGRAVVIVWFFAGILGLEVEERETHLVWCALTGLLVAALVVRRFLGLDGVRIAVSAPRMITVGEEVAFTVRLENRGEKEHLAVEVDGPLLPWDGRYVSERARVARLEPGAAAEVTLRARFVARGAHHLDPFIASAVAPFGLSSGPVLGSQGVRFLIVPPIAPVARLRTPQVQRFQPGGVALASQTGESMELKGLRPYRPGDPVRDLHARRWARLGAPVVREYQQEYFTRVGVVVDTDTRIADEDRLEAGLSLGAGVVSHLSRGESLIDLLVVGQELRQLTLGRSLGFVDQALELLACVEPGPAFDPVALGRRLAPHLARLSCVVFVALGWDAARQQLVDHVRRGGVRCRVLLVTRDRDADAGARGDVDLTEIAARSIRSSRGLAL
jgi:uncharacterized protein (DUF58 family)